MMLTTRNNFKTSKKLNKKMIQWWQKAVWEKQQAKLHLKIIPQKYVYWFQLKKSRSVIVSSAVDVYTCEAWKCKSQREAELVQISRVIEAGGMIGGFHLLSICSSYKVNSWWFKRYRRFVQARETPSVCILLKVCGFD